MVHAASLVEFGGKHPLVLVGSAPLSQAHVQQTPYTSYRVVCLIWSKTTRTNREMKRQKYVFNMPCHFFNPSICKYIKITVPNEVGYRRRVISHATNGGILTNLSEEQIDKMHKNPPSPNYLFWFNSKSRTLFYGSNHDHERSSLKNNYVSKYYSQANKWLSFKKDFSFRV